MSPDVGRRKALRDHEYLEVIDELGYLLGRLFVGLVFGGHPDLRSLLDDLLADSVNAEVELRDGARALGARHGLLADFSE